jgi:oxygen-independent coproporphyrinogen-3 oxidase
MAAESTVSKQTTVDPRELPFEFMLNALRLIDGFPLALFAERTGLRLAAVEVQLAEAERKDLLQRDWQRLRPTGRGRLFLNELLGLFVA